MDLISVFSVLHPPYNGVFGGEIRGAVGEVEDRFWKPRALFQSSFLGGSKHRVPESPEYVINEGSDFIS